MAERTDEPTRLVLAADAFLFSAAVDIVATALAFGVPSMLGVDMAAGVPWGALLSWLLTIAAVFGGAMLAWRLHDRSLDKGLVFAMLAGTAVGAPLALGVLVAGATVMIRIGPRGPDEPPWVAIGVLAALALAFACVPLVDAARDAAASGRRHVRLDWVRVIAFVVAVGVAGLLAYIGIVKESEIGEAGIFMVPFAAGGAFAALGADTLYRIRRNKKPGPLDALQGGRAAEPGTPAEGDDPE